MIVSPPSSASKRCRRRAASKDENAAPFAFKSGHRVGAAKAIEMRPQAKKLLADKATTPGLRRTMVKTAIIMGIPVKDERRS